MDISGYVVLGIATLFFLYLMPQLIRSRQDVVDSRVDDRFSADLRILATAGTVGSPPRPVFDDDGATRAYLHDPRLRTEVSAMNRPPALGSRAASTTTPRPPVGAPRPISAATQARSAARAESVRRRRAAARRRLILSLVLLAATVAAWAGVAFGLTAGAVAAIPTVVLAVVLVLGRRAAVAGQRIEHAWRQEDARASAEPAPARAPRAESESAQPVRRTGAARPERAPQARAVADPVTELIPRMEVEASATGLTWHGEPTAPDVAEVDATPAESGRTAPEAAAPEGSWTPVPVPVPTYTLKPQAPRRDAAPLVLDEPAPEVKGAASAPASEDRAADGGVPARALDLDAVLSRRRAAGE